MRGQRDLPALMRKQPRENPPARLTATGRDHERRRQIGPSLTRFILLLTVKGGDAKLDRKPLRPVVRPRHVMRPQLLAGPAVDRDDLLPQPDNDQVTGLTAAVSPKADADSAVRF